MDLSEINQIQQLAVAESLVAGLKGFAIPYPLSLAEWAAKHFYLSTESSYDEQAWKAWPYQEAIMACISNDEIEEVDWMKSARTGNTKIMLAAIGYFAEHKRRNQAMWQPTDDDRTEFVKTELDTMLRDVAIMQHVFPSHISRHRDNTLSQKNFIGSTLHLKGGKAAKNYRRISIDVGYIDEADAFDRDVEKEGDPYTLAAKRAEGSTFPKMVVGGTPKSKGFSLIEDRTLLADERFRFYIPCPHCEKLHLITWGGKDEPHGFKWHLNEEGEPDPDSVRHLCPHCASLITQGEYLSAWNRGIFANEDLSIFLDGNGVFKDAAGNILPAPRHLAFLGVWTAYSPAASWPQILRDFWAAHKKKQAGDNGLMKAFVNTTKGEPWEKLTPTTSRRAQNPTPWALSRWAASCCCAPSIRKTTASKPPCAAMVVAARPGPSPTKSSTAAPEKMRYGTTSKNSYLTPNSSTPAEKPCASLRHPLTPAVTSHKPSTISPFATSTATSLPFADLQAVRSTSKMAFKKWTSTGAAASRSAACSFGTSEQTSQKTSCTAVCNSRATDPVTCTSPTNSPTNGSSSSPEKPAPNARERAPAKPDGYPFASALKPGTAPFTSCGWKRISNLPRSQPSSGPLLKKKCNPQYSICFRRRKKQKAKRRNYKKPYQPTPTPRQPPHRHRKNAPRHRAA